VTIANKPANIYSPKNVIKLVIDNTNSNNQNYTNKLPILLPQQQQSQQQQLYVQHTQHVLPLTPPEPNQSPATPTQNTNASLPSTTTASPSRFSQQVSYGLLRQLIQNQQVFTSSDTHTNRQYTIRLI